MGIAEIDTSLFILINKNLQNGFFDILMPFVSKNTVPIFLLAVLLSALKDRKKIWLFTGIALVAVALADGSGNLLKDLFARQRPCNTIEGINLLVGCGHAFSMPSNHTANAFAFAMVFLFMRGKALSWFLVFIAAAVGFSRVYTGAHYPFDVLAGGLLGAGVAYLSIQLYRWAAAIYAKRSYEQALYFSILLMSLFRIYFILTGPFDLTPDEAHYWEWARHPDWSYYSKGPMIAYLIYIGTAVFGDNVFGVRILAVVLSALSSIILYKLGSELYDEKTGLASALLIQIVPLYSVFGVLLTIDSPFIFVWVLSLFYFHRAVNSSLPGADRKPSDLYWVVLGISLGIGMLTKYTMAFFYLSGFLFFVFHKDARRLLTSRGPYISLLVSMIIFSPVIVWNAAHDWVTFRHTAGQAHIADGLTISAKSFFEFIGSQLGVVTPLLIVLIFIAVWRLRKDKEGAFLFWFSAPVIVFFLLKSLQAKVQANWALTAYLTGFIAFAAYYLRDFRRSKKTVKILTVSALLLAFIVTVFAHFPAILNLPPKKDPTIRLVGWKELGREVSRIYAEMSTRGPVFIFSDRYQISSELAFYVEGHPATYCINLGRRMNQYDLWPGFDKLIGHNAILVRIKSRKLPENVKNAFETCDKEVINIRTKQNKIVKFTAYKCYDFKGIEFKPPEFF